MLLYLLFYYIYLYFSIGFGEFLCWKLKNIKTNPFSMNGFVFYILSVTSIYYYLPLANSFSASWAISNFCVAFPAASNSPVFRAMLILTATRINITIIVIIKAIKVIPLFFDFSFLWSSKNYPILFYTILSVFLILCNI